MSNLLFLNRDYNNTSGTWTAPSTGTDTNQGRITLSDKVYAPSGYKFTDYIVGVRSFCASFEPDSPGGNLKELYPAAIGYGVYGEALSNNDQELDFTCFLQLTDSSTSSTRFINNKSFSLSISIVLNYVATT
jgi:hypothetical protein